MSDVGFFCVDQVFERMKLAASRLRSDGRENIDMICDVCKNGWEGMQQDRCEVCNRNVCNDCKERNLSWLRFRTSKVTGSAPMILCLPCLKFRIENTVVKDDPFTSLSTGPPVRYSDRTYSDIFDEIWGEREYLGKKARINRIWAKQFELGIFGQ